MVSGAGPLSGQFCLECVFSFEALFPVGQSSLILFVIAGLCTLCFSGFLENHQSVVQIYTKIITNRLSTVPIIPNRAKTDSSFSSLSSCLFTSSNVVMAALLIFSAKTFTSVWTAGQKEGKKLLTLWILPPFHTYTYTHKSNMYITHILMYMYSILCISQ